MRVAVIGHVEHITLAPVDTLPAAGDIVHLHAPVTFPGGGGGVAFYQLLRSKAEVLLYTAIGNDDAGAYIRYRLAQTRARVFAATRAEPHTRDVVVVTPDGERTILVVGEPLHPRRTDALPWNELATCDAVYFTAQDHEVLRAARAARLVVVTARRKQALAHAGVRADVIVGSLRDPRERSTLADYPTPPAALVLTDGKDGGTIETAAGTTRFSSPAIVDRVVGAYGAGDSFAAALTYYLGAGHELADAATRASHHGAAVLAGLVPLDHQLALT
jgi:ribokinase